MMESIQSLQLNIMLCLCSICGLLAVFTYVTKTLSKRRRNVLMYMEISAMILLYADRYTYISNGGRDLKSFILVRVSNFIVFFFTILVIHAFNLYLEDIVTSEAGLDKIPVRLRIVDALLAAGALLIIISQFTGLYYTFDENNVYHRAPGFIICYLFPLAAPLIQFTVILSYRMKISRLIRTSLFIFSIIPVTAAIIQIFTYGLSLTNIALVGTTVILYVFAYMDLNNKAEKANEIRAEMLAEEKEQMRRLFDQTAEAFVSAIDARDDETQGHSARVAGYARKIAEISGKNREECDKVYYAALLHDVGKIGIPDSILNKDGDLSKEENEIVKKQPVIGNQILSSIDELPYLKDGAHYHMERYDGGGYPDGLKGEEIPEIARIIAVADAYDMMTSKTGYRDPMPQQIVREEIIKGSGTRFDPKYAGIMKELIDQDIRYQMTGEESGFDTVWQTEFHCKEYRSGVSYGIEIKPEVMKISFNSSPDGEFREDYSIPSLIIFDALDGHVHDTIRTINDTRYLEYGEIWFDGHHLCTGARDMHMTYIEDYDQAGSGEYLIEASRYRDHVRLILTGEGKKQEIIIALSDSSRAVYISLTGEHCLITDIEINKTDVKTGEGDIPRIADEISYIDRMQSDVPNVQIDGYRTDSTEGVKVKDGMRIIFHTMSLPTASLVWHCPFIVLYHSDDGKPFGSNYREYALVRLDGEAQPSDESADNKLDVKKSESFAGWDKWKEYNQKGFECEATIVRRGKKITTSTDNFGISIRNVTTLADGTEDVYMTLSGDQCALTDIRIMTL